MSEKMKYFSIFILLFIISLVKITYANTECQRKKFDQDSFVCVCNEKTCDTFDKLNKTTQGIVQVYESSRNDFRFRPSQINFTKSGMILSNDDHIQINVDRTKKYQKIIGFGGAFTDAAGLNIASLSKKLQSQLIEDYFGSNGIEYTLGRIPIGGSDFSSRPYTYDDFNDDDSLSKFSLQMEDYQFKIPYLKMAQKISPNKLHYYASPWSSPRWMKTNNDIRHGGLLKGHPGEKYYKLFAKYIVRFLQEYDKQNISLWGITIENEPGAGFDPNYKWNCLGFNSTLERDFLKLDLGPELHQNGYTKNKLAVMIYDDQMPQMKTFTETVMADAETAKYVSGVAFHWYNNDKADRNDLDKLNAKFPNIFLLATEACEEWKNSPKKVHLGSWHLMNRYANDIIKDLNHYSTGWTDWNLALDLNGGPNWAGNMVDAPIIINATANEYYKQPSFYAMGHFSKFLPPNSTRIHWEIESNLLNKIDVTTFSRPDGSLVMILLNQNPKTIPIQVYDRERGHFQFVMASESIATFLWY
ncbi:lysosomal acid glucosylceramidase-like [Dermatophagoides pteronyssinus]|uniref:lysosomal acid glucosylceramidase-like n=1 Tax=Dermatophagoides pteronyssinus TaxID=6956 RepID=UPI003F6776FE